MISFFLVRITREFNRSSYIVCETILFIMETHDTKLSQLRRTLEFMEEVKVDGKSTDKFKCSICSKQLNGKTKSNLVVHFKNVHKKIYLDKISERCEESIGVQRLRTLYSCVEMVTLDSIPFSFLSSNGFRNAMVEKLSSFQLAGCPINLSDHHVYEIKEKVREVAKDIKARIKEEVAGKIISVMIDSATRNGRAAYGINIQYRHNGVFKLTTLAMRELKKAHTAKYLADVLLEVLVEYRITLAQIISLTTDSGSNMLAMVREIEKILFGDGDMESSQNDPNPQRQMNVEENTARIGIDEESDIDGDIEHLLGEQFIDDDDVLGRIMCMDVVCDENNLYGELLESVVREIRTKTGNHFLFVTSIKCAAHTLQLAICDALALLGKADQNLISLCRQAAKFMRLQSTKDTMRRVKLSSILPALDVATRWSSTYKMCHDVLKCKHIVQCFAPNHSIFKLLEKKWDALDELERILYVPHLTTKLLQQKEFTLSDFFGSLKIIIMKLEQFIAKPAPKHTKLAEKLLHCVNVRKEKLVQNPLMLCAIFLDPRYKCELDSYPEKQQIVKMTLECIWERIKLVKNEPEVETEANTLRVSNTSHGNMDMFYDELDKHYDTVGIASASVDQSSPVANLTRDASDIAILIHQYDISNSIRMKSSASVIEYWESKKSEWAELYEIASIIIAVPPAQASVVRNFSALKYMLTDRRYNLSEDLLESLLTTHLNSDYFETVKNSGIENFMNAQSKTNQ